MILLDKYYALEKADNQYQLGIIDEQTKISIIKFLNSLPSAQSDNGYSDGFADGYKRGLTDAQPDNQTNLCDSCYYSYPDCPSEADDVIFGNGIGNDNICACNKYKPSAQPLTAYVISDEDGNIKCSNCGSFECWGNYCMNCGAKMVDPQESEDKKKLSWLGKRCEDCGNKKCKEFGELPKGYDCALWQAEREV